MSPNQKTNPSKKEFFEQGKNEDSMGTNVYSAKDNQSMHKSLNGQFILYQLLIERLLDEKTALPQITNSGIYQYFQPDNENDQEIMREFDQDYQSEKAIHWYTRETCVYKLLNKALRTQNIDHVMAFAKLVRDLNKQLKEQHKLFSKTKKSSILTVFRGQFISKDELNRLKTTKGELISMNSFLSTSANKQKAIEFATTRSPPTDELTSILIEMQVNIKSQSRPLADIQHLSAFSDEEEILFMFGCIFRLDDVWYDDDLKIWRARLTLCGDGDLDMTDFLSSLDIELEGKNRLISLGIYLFQMQKYKEAEEHYEKVFEDKLTTDPIELAYCHHGLAQVNEKKVDYQAAIDNLEKALNYLSSENDHSLISKCYNDLGSIYNKQGQHRLAFQSYEKALKTMNNIPSTTYSGLAQIHFQFHNYNLAIEYLQKALDNHPSTAYISMANTYIEMGNIYAKMHDKDTHVFKIA